MNLLRITALLTVLLTATNARASGLTIQVEDYLYCPGIKPSDSNRKAMAKIVEERYSLARSITLASMPVALTFFGMRIDEPAEVLAWREKEDQRVRELIAPSEIDVVRQFARTVRDQTSTVDHKFPLNQGITISMAQSVQEVDGEKKLKIDISVPANSPDYKMQYQAEMNGNGVLVVRLTMIRPSFYLLMGHEPETAQLKATIKRDGKLPKSIEVWTRTIDADLPLNLKFQRVGTAEVASN